MRLDGVEVLTVRLALREPVASAGLVHTDKTTLFVRVRADGRSGWGECAAYPGARPPDATVAAVEMPIDHAVARLFDASPDGQVPDPEVVSVACGGGSVVEQSAAAALEMAVFDLTLAATGRSLAEAVGAVRDRVEYGAVVGIPRGRDLGELTDRIAAALEAGVRRVRIKIEPGWERAPLAAARARFPEAVLSADANGSFVPGDSSLLRSLDEFSLRCLEQPFGPADLESHGALASAMATPIGLDESLWSVDRVRQALAAGACRVACLKPGRLGGLFPATDAASACATAGVACFVGGFFETGLGRAANAALAGRPEFGLPGDVGPPDRYLDADPFTSLPVSEGTVTLSANPGIGVVSRDGVLLERALRRRWIPWSAQGTRANTKTR
jgi:O-succinylbenzoate synthase